MQNLLSSIPTVLPEELSEVLLQAKTLRIERIVSRGHASPPDFWYDQEQAEWVLLVQGGARLQFVDETVELHAGDFVNIPAHRKHRVAWTTPETPTVWLALFYD